MARGSAILSVIVVADAKKAQKELQRAADASKGWGDSVAGASAAAGTAMAAAGTIAYKSAQDASDLAESQNKVATVYGQSASEIEAWAATASSSMGMSKQAALDAAGGFGTFFTQIGIGQAEAAAMSTEMVELSADIASFHNVQGGAAAVTDAMSAAMRGEYDAIQKFIPTINAAAVQTKAMAMTGKESAAALTEQDKAMAAYQLILEGAGPAVGDFARTSESAANQQRQMEAALTDASAAIGAAFLPILEELLPVIVSMAEFVSQNADAIANLITVVGAAGAAILTLNAGMSAYNTVSSAASGVTKLFKSDVDASGKSIKGTSTAMKSYTSVKRTFTKVTQTATKVVKALWKVLKMNPIGLIITAVTALVSIFVKAYKECDKFRAAVDKIWKLIKNTVIKWFDKLSNSIETVVGWFKDAWQWCENLVESMKDLVVPDFLQGGGGIFRVAPGAAGASTLSTTSTRSTVSGGSTINITIQGAIDPVGTAETIRRILSRQDARVGRPSAPIWTAA